LTPVSGGREWAEVRGLVLRAEARPAARPVLRLFVNGRPVRDRALSRAVVEAYRSAGLSQARPEGALFIGVPPELLDVNVHPAKTEVRFSDARLVFEAVAGAVRDALARGSRARPPTAHSGPRGSLASPASGSGPGGPEGARGDLWSSWSGEPAPGVAGPHSVAAEEALLFGPAGPTVLGQHRNTYIVATDGEELLLVDQHTAHERIRFEELLARRAQGVVPAQGLVVPAVHHLAPRLRPVAEARAGDLAVAGFEVEPYGGEALRIRAVPAFLAGRDPGPMLEALLADLLDRDSSGWVVTDATERMLATVACHSAVRAGHALRPPVMEEIVRGLADTRHPGVCPHGRPTLVRIPREDVSRWFGRTGWRRQ
jgi:DNA mismatch repair protein MutL